ncbi:MAG: glycosyltransferase family 2 protein, partial [Planctomycetota bacterium]
MSAWLVLMLIAVVICAGALVMTVINLGIYRPAPAAGETGTLVSVCVPARDEERNLEPAVTALLASRHEPLEVLVYDDESEDSTPTILARLQAADPRVRAVPTAPLPAGWVGKQFACWQMAQT